MIGWDAKSLVGGHGEMMRSVGQDALGQQLDLLRRCFHGLVAFACRGGMKGKESQYARLGARDKRAGWDGAALRWWWMGGYEYGGWIASVGG